MSTHKYRTDSPYCNPTKEHPESDYKYTGYKKRVNGDVEKPTPIRTALFALGRAGMIHLENLLRNPRFELFYIVEGDKVKVDNIKNDKRLKGCKFVDPKDTEEVLKDPELDAVVVATPTYTHFEIVMKSLGQNKAVLCEKPLASTSEDIEKCYRAAEKANKPLLCAFNRRFDPSFRKLRDKVGNGEVGEVHCIKTVSRDCPLPSIDYIKTSGGLFHDTSVHDIDLICWILGQYPNKVLAAAHTFIPELKKIDDYDTALIIMQFPSGTLATVDLSRNSVYGYDQRLEAFGPKGMICCPNESPYLLTSYLNHNTVKPPMYYSFPSRYQDAYFNELEHFCDAIKGFTEVMITQESTINVHKVALALEESVKTGSFVEVNY